MTDEEPELWDAIVDEIIESNKELLTRIGSEIKFWWEPAGPGPA